MLATLRHLIRQLPVKQHASHGTAPTSPARAPAHRFFHLRRRAFRVHRHCRRNSGFPLAIKNAPLRSTNYRLHRRRHRLPQKLSATHHFPHRGGKLFLLLGRIHHAFAWPMISWRKGLKRQDLLRRKMTTAPQRNTVSRDTRTLRLGAQFACVQRSFKLYAVAWRLAFTYSSAAFRRTLV